MKKFLKRILLIFLIVFLLGNLLGYLSLKIHSEGNFYKPSFAVNAHKPVNYDYVVVGASTGLTTINTGLIDSLAHTKGLNLSMDDTNISSHYLMLQHFLAQGNTVSKCILAPAVGSYNDANNESSTNDYRFAMFAESSYVTTYFNTIEEKSLNSRLIASASYMPMAVESYYNAELFFTSLYVLTDFKKRNRFDQNGNYTYPPKRNVQRFQKKPFELKFSNPYLKKLEALCLEHNIELLYFVSPIANKHVTMEPHSHLLDYSNFIKDPIYFYDAIHVNSEGRKLVSQQLADTLFSNNSVKN